MADDLSSNTTPNYTPESRTTDDDTFGNTSSEWEKNMSSPEQAQPTQTGGRRRGKKRGGKRSRTARKSRKSRKTRKSRKSRKSRTKIYE